MKTVVELMSVENPVFTNFVAWSSLLIIKTMLMSIFTAVKRMITKTPANPEDAAQVGSTQPPGAPNDSVERVRRAHLNDLENVLPYLSVGLFYVWTDPNPTVAIVMFITITVSRFLHTFVYTIWVLPQPTRTITWFIPYACTLYMAVMCVICFIAK